MSFLSISAYYEPAYCLANPSSDLKIFESNLRWRNWRVAPAIEFERSSSLVKDEGEREREREIGLKKPTVVGRSTLAVDGCADEHI